VEKCILFFRGLFANKNFYHRKIQNIFSFDDEKLKHRKNFIFLFALT
jgi:hypothetical protein